MGEGREARREEREKSGEVVAVTMAAVGGARTLLVTRADGRYLIRADEQGMKAERGALLNQKIIEGQRRGRRTRTCLGSVTEGIEGPKTFII